MAAYAWALPVKDKERGMKLIEELTAERGSEHHGRTREHGFSRLKIFRQDSPQEMVIVYAEAPDVKGSLKSASAAANEFDKWLHDTVEKVTGHNMGDLHRSGPMSQLLLDWHPEKGHSRTGHD